jgi:hypothetical protein
MRIYVNTYLRIIWCPWEPAVTAEESAESLDQTDNGSRGDALKRKACSGGGLWW